MANNNIPKWIEPKLFENVLHKTIKDFQEICEFKAENALAPGENYATVMLRIHIKVLLTNGSTQSESFMLKVAPDTELYREEMYKWNVFNIEAGMYRNIKPEFEKLYTDAGLQLSFGCKSHELPSTVDQEYILLEDLSKRGFKNVKRQNCLDMEHCQSVLKKIAQWHAASAVMVQQKGMYEHQYTHGIISDNSKDLCKSMFDSAIPFLLKTAKRLPNHEDFYDQIESLNGKLTDTLFEQTSLDEHEFNVLNHGDCWANNIMFQYDDEGKLLETYLVDLQGPRYGTPAQDLLYFIISSAQLDIKVAKFDYMIKYYHDNLIEHLKLLKYESPLPTLRDIHKSLIKFGIWGFLTVAGVMGAILCDPTDSASLDNFVADSDAGNKFKELFYSNDRYVSHLKVVLPWLCYRGAISK